MEISKENLDRLKRLRLMDDDFMVVCFQNNKECVELVLSIILNRQDLKVQSIKTQERLHSLTNRSVVLDVTAMDTENNQYNIEIQRADEGANERRARYHSSIIDTTLLRKGQGYKELPENYVIFITENDVIGAGLPLYTIRRYIEETRQVFEDGTSIYYVNGKYQGEDKLGKLVHDFNCTDASQMQYRLLADRVRFFKESEEGVNAMCKIWEEVRQEGVEQKEQETILRMLKKNKYSIEEIADNLEVSIERVKKLKERLEN